MSVRVILVAGGPLSLLEGQRLKAAVSTADLLHAVDGGARHLLRLGLVPQIVSGDFDSLDRAERDALERQGAEILPTPDQDFTDLDKAIRIALEQRGATEIRVFAATGGRLDHIYSALSTVVKYGRRLPVRLVDGVGVTWLVAGEEILTGEELLGRTLSLLAMGPVEGVYTTGVRWPLYGERLAPGYRDGTLNLISEPVVSVRVASGDLLVMVHHAREESREDDRDADMLYYGGGL